MADIITTIAVEATPTNAKLKQARLNSSSSKSPRFVTKSASITSYISTIGVPAIDRYLSAVEALGGTIAVDKMPIPAGGWLAYGKDPDGNIFGLMEQQTASTERS